jgi:molybdate-binding protein/DNA-binding XRE family transcriptional regulator
MKVRNNLAELRRARRLSVIQLASLIGVTRQTVYAMEANSYVPNTLLALRLAGVLDVCVEDIFQLEATHQEARETTVELLSNGTELHPGSPLRLCQIEDRLIGVEADTGTWSLPAADASLINVTQKGQKLWAQANLHRNPEDIKRRLLLAGCDPAVSVLMGHLQRERVEVIAKHENSTTALDLLRRGMIHVAGSHIQAAASTGVELTAIRARAAGVPLAAFTMATWEVGLVIARGNPKGVHGIADLARKEVTLVNREPGSGSRALLEQLLKQSRIESKDIRGYDHIASGHLQVSRCISQGRADCGIAVRAAAQTFGLDFIPLTTERYDLVVRMQSLDLPLIQTFVETLGQPEFRHDLERVGGYDTTHSGNRLG